MDFEVLLRTLDFPRVESRTRTRTMTKTKTAVGAAITGNSSTAKATGDENSPRDREEDFPPA
jgi:hypothetical protein